MTRTKLIQLAPEAPTLLGMYQVVRDFKVCYLEGTYPHPQAGFKYPGVVEWRPRGLPPRHVPTGEAICRECHREAFITLHGFDPWDSSADRRTKLRRKRERATGKEKDGGHDGMKMWLPTWMMREERSW